MSDELDKTPENPEIVSGEISAPEADGEAAVRKNTDANAYFRAMMSCKIICIVFSSTIFSARSL